MTAKSILSQIDNTDDRREIRRCLELLPPIERVAFLYAACDMIGPIGISPKGEGVFLTITNETGDPSESFLDLMQMVSQYGLNIKLCLIELERRARQFSRPAGIEIIQ